MPSSPDPKSLVSDYLAQSEEPDIEELCERHPEHADELRKLWAEEERIRALIGEALPKGSGSVFARRGRDRAVSAPQVAARVGDAIGEFRLIEVLGHGGMGQVWMAEQTSLGRRVALKLVRPECVNERTMALFAREARAGGRLSHPGIVSVHGYGESDGVAWIAMELVEGAWTLRDAIDELDADEELPKDYYDHVARFVAELADALQAAHDAGVIHRDLKPQNILVTQDDKPKLTDFGLARITDETAISVTGDFAGTYFYMSPEQVAARRMGIDHRTDVFSLGVVFYEMLTLQRPFQGDTTHQVAEQIVVKDPPGPRLIRSKVPEDLAVIVGKCLEKDRDRRYLSMGDLAADLRRHLGREPILAKPPSRVRRAYLWARRHPHIVEGAAIGVVLGGYIGFLLWQKDAMLEQMAHQASELQGDKEIIERQATSLELRMRVEKTLKEGQAKLRAEAEAERDAVLRLSAQQDLEELLAEQAELWPPHPEQLPALRAWRQRAEALVKGLEGHKDKREQLLDNALKRLALAKAASAEAVLGMPVGEQPSDHRWVFEAKIKRALDPSVVLSEGRGEDAEEGKELVEALVTEERWWVRNLSKLIDGLQALEGDLLADDAATTEYGWSVGRRLAFAERMQEAYSLGKEFDLLWKRDLPAIHQAYSGLDLTPQMGLIPIGPDPGSGLWEFAHLESGKPTVRGKDGKLIMTEESGIVFVLIPEGWLQRSSHRGASAQGEGGADSQSEESEAYRLFVPHFFLSKFELTQGQCQELSGMNPSARKVGSNRLVGSRLHPVEHITWGQASQLMQRFGLNLPWEAQWEYACLAPEFGEWPFLFEEFAGSANICDASYVRGFPDNNCAEWNDGYPVHAPVGKFKPNAFGLHDMIGNVWEWCADWNSPSRILQVGGQGVSSEQAGWNARVMRGASFNDPVSLARPRVRANGHPSAPNSVVGVRPSRAVKE